MRKAIVALTLLVAFTTACSVLTRPATATLTPVPSTNVVQVSLSEVNYNKSLAVGTTATLEAWFDPTVYAPMIDSDGSVSGRSMAPWESPNIAEMRICFSTSSSCQPEGDWIPYAEKQQFPILVDWLGPHKFWLAAEFRDSSGNSILSLDNSSLPQAVTEVSAEITGFWDTATPIGNQPAPVQTAVAATLAAYPVTGSVVLEGGKDSLGAKAGSTIDIGMEFTAASPYGQVTEMRMLRGCGTEADMAEATWEPFAVSKTIPVKVIINWAPFEVSVQYRDEHGNLSQVYCDDINVEGMP